MRKTTSRSSDGTSAISSSARKYRASTTILLHHLEARTGKNEAGNSPPREREAGRNDASQIEEDNTARREPDEAPKQELEAGIDTMGQIIRARISRIRFVILIVIKR